MRYIDADALIEKIFPYDLVGKRLYSINAKAVYDAICAMPTADVVAVVRCKDCKLRDKEGCPFMYLDCGILLGCTADKDYCNYGERKE